MFSVGQVAAVKAAFSLAGYSGQIRTLPVESEDERLFVVTEGRVSLEALKLLDQVLTQLLGRKVAVLVDRAYSTVPFT